MKGIQINPYHAVAIYDNDTESSLQGHLYSPLDRLPDIQFFTSAATRVEEWELVRVSDGAIYAQDAAQWYIFTLDSGGRFHTYFGEELLAHVPDGIYRAKITMFNGDVYWSHAICCSTLFAGIDLDFGLTLDMCEQTNGYHLSLTATGADYVDIYLGGVFQNSAGPEFEISGPYVLDELREYTITLKRDYEASNGGRVTVQKEFSLTLTASDACGTYVLTPGTATGGYGEELAYIEWWETTDRQAQGILYQSQSTGDETTDTYRQRFYGKFWRAFPVPFIEDAFLVDANGNRVRQSSTTGETLVLECWPVPDYAFTVLANAGNHDNITVQNLDGETTVIDRFEFASEPVGDDDRAKGIFSMTIETAYVAGCQDDYTPAGD